MGFASACMAQRVRRAFGPRFKQAEREEAIADWLADHGLDQRPMPTRLPIRPSRLKRSISLPPPSQGRLLTRSLRWAAAGCAVRGLASEIQEAAMRISGLVMAIKGFTHMDQAMVAEPVDLGPSLGNTVAVLESQGAPKSVAVAIELKLACRKCADLPAN